MMYFVKGTTCTYCKTRAGTNFEAGTDRMKKKLQGYNVGSADNLQDIISFLVHLAQ